MPETIGTLNLKIARLKKRLNLLEQQQLLSRPYPYLQYKLMQQDKAVRFQLDQLLQYREVFSGRSMSI